MEFPIKTIVILVQENRSFDHMLGWMKSLNPEIDGVTGTESNLKNTSNPNSDIVYFKNEAVHVSPDPGHSFQAVYEQLYGIPWNTELSLSSSPSIPSTMGGFVQQGEKISPEVSESVMNGFTPEMIPVYKELVSEFCVCDRWFSSVPSSTQPNRLFVHSGTSHGATSNDTNLLIKGFPQKTIFDSLDEAGRSFGIYYQYPPSTLFYRNLRKLKYIKNFHQYELEFKRHCKEGKLPNYVVIEQRYLETILIPGNDDHPSHDVAEGQKFVREVYETLRASPQWNELLFLIIYDEHGGFYDHVPPPSVGVPNPDGLIGPEPFNFKFDRLGVRVPAILISPWIERGTVLHGPNGPYPSSEFEHSSVAATTKKIFNLKDFLTKRDEWAGTFDCVITRSAPRTDCPVTLPDPKKTREIEVNENAKLSDFQKELVQMAATLNGDHSKNTYPHELVENMFVSDAVQYVGDAFNRFLDEFEKAKNNGVDESEVIVVSSDAPPPNPRSPPNPPSLPNPPKKSKSFAQKLFSCLVCNNK